MEKIDFTLKYKHEWIHHPLGIITKIDDRIINVDISGKQEITIKKKINLQNADHKLHIEVANKNESNTIVDENFNVVQDSLVTLTSIELNEIEVLPLIYHSSIQSFYINNQKDQILHKIVELGHNGTWEFCFKTPIYDWMLESLF
jgi:hypothetical protein